MAGEDVLLGDGVRFEDQQRLDIQDARDLQLVVYEHIRRVMGALLGDVQSGIFAEIASAEFDLSNLAAIPVPECIFYDANDDTTVPANPQLPGVVNTKLGGFIRHDPSLSGQVSTLDLSGYLAGNDLATIYARRTLVEDGNANRIKWDSAGQVEVLFATNTRFNERVVFGTALAGLPDASPGWFAWGKITSWPGGVLPYISLYHPFDLTVLGVEDGTRRVFRGTAGVADGSNAKGLSAAISRIIEVLAQRRDSGAGTSWAEPPIRTLTTIHTDLSLLESAMTTAQADITALEAVNVDFAPTRILFHGFMNQITAITFDNIQVFTARAAGVTRTFNYDGVGEYTFVIGADVRSVVVSAKLNQSGANDSIVHGTTNVIASVGTLAYAGGPNESTFKVYLSDDAGGKVDQSFFITVSGTL